MSTIEKVAAGLLLGLALCATASGAVILPPDHYLISDHGQPRVFEVAKEELRIMSRDHGRKLLKVPPLAGAEQVRRYAEALPKAVGDEVEMVLYEANAPRNEFTRRVLTRQEQKKKFLPNDPLLANQWHVNNTGQNTGTAGIDINVTNVWDRYRGDGLRIGIVDDGLEYTHPDLASNADVGLDWDFNDNDDDPMPDAANYDGYANSIYTIAITAASDQGQQTDYGEPGACLIVATPSNSLGQQQITTTDLVGRDGYNQSGAPGDLADLAYTQTFSGTSAATSLAAGVIALVLQANPNLGWRDVQEILIKSATKISPGDNDWMTNSAYFEYRLAKSVPCGTIITFAHLAESNGTVFTNTFHHTVGPPPATWTLQTVDSAGTVGSYTSVAVDSQGIRASVIAM